MEDKIYREEYVREQARLAARADAQPKPHKKSRLLQYAAPALFLALFGYSIFTVGSISSLDPGIFLDPDFLLAGLALTGLFLWARLS